MSAPEEKTNLVAQIEAFGLEHFRIVERPLAPLRHHEIRIHVHAASLKPPRPRDRTRSGSQSRQRHPPAARPALRLFR